MMSFFRSLRTAFAAVFCLLAFAADGSAAVSAVLRVETSMDELEFLRGEDIYLTVRVRNSGSTIFVVDDYGDYLRNKISIVMRDAANFRLVAPIAGPSEVALAVRQLTVPPGTERTIRVNLASLYDFSRHGRYQVTVLLQRGEEEYAQSRTIAFSIVEGIEIVSARNALGSNESRPLRFALLYWERSKRQDLFLRISDPANHNRTVGFVSLGPVVRVSEPTMTFQGTSAVTIVQQTGRDHYARTVIDTSRLPLRVTSREDNLLSGEAFQQELNRRIISDRIRERERTSPGEKRRGSDFFGR